VIKQYKQPQNGKSPNPGIFPNVSNDHYHNSENWNMLSAGGLKTLIKQSPLHFITAQNNTETTGAMNFGSAYHSYILEPELNEVIEAPDVDRRTKAGKADWLRFQKSLDGQNKTVVTKDEMETIKAMREMLMKSQTASSLIEGAQTELSATWKHHVHGFDCKCRPDIFYKNFYEGMNIIGDLKTCKDASPEEFGKTIINSHYHIQAYWYRLGIEQLTNMDWEFVLIAQEKTPPYGVGIYQIPTKAFLIAKRDIDIAMHVYNECLKDNHWPCYEDKFKSAIIPAWAK
jgi:hypothetical protein